MEYKKLVTTIRQWFYLKTRKKLVNNSQMEPPFRAELFTADQMEQHGKALALSHTLAKNSAPNTLLNRLSNNEASLVKNCRILASITEKNRITPAGEWLLDNFYLIEEQIRTTKHHLPKGYGKSLPQLAGGRSQKHLRVYDIALQNIAHGDGHWDPESLRRFVSAYQSVTTLTLGELWAIPIMLRLALIENLRRIGVQVVADQIDRNLAENWANRLMEVAETDPKNLILIIADMANSAPPLQGAFVAELVRRLQGRGAALALPLTWIDEQLAESGLNIEQLIQEENRQQAADQVSVSNSIASLRRLGEMDWRKFVETLSVVDWTLCKDPAAAYSNMDFETRDSYRHVIEHLARNNRRPEEQVAEIAIELAKTAVANDTSLDQTERLRRSHVGYYLLGAGLTQLEQAVEAHHFGLEKLRHINVKARLSYYLGAIVLITVGFTSNILFKASQMGITTLWLILLGIVVILATSQLAVALVNWVATLFIKPQPLPKMDFSKGIPSQWRTLVAVPAMLGKNVAQIEALVEALEIRFLGNRDDSLHFALLTDFNDATQEHCADDDKLLAVARERIDALNKRYPGVQYDNFFLFHRPRRWNPVEEVWMGHERKRGKLTDLNALLRGGKKTHFSLIVGRTDVLAEIKYVITLDSDTQLSRDSARKFVAAMAHPLNRPRYDMHLQRVVEGHGILQPRIADALPKRGQTRYARLSGSEPGIDPYTRSVSNVYQDLFGEGSFIGKGIYDVDMFEQVLGHRFPENLILSHDLLEGCYLRSGLLSDVPLYEQSPSSYFTDATRRTRWIRGDWQLVGWLLPRVLSENRKLTPNHLSTLSRWKLFDNLRRSLVPVSLMALLILGWTVIPQVNFALDIVLIIVLLPAVLATLVELVRKPTDALLKQHIITVIRAQRWHYAQLALYLACLPHEAWYSLCAIIRTGWRLAISHRHLLEWIPSAQAEHGFRNTLLQWIKALWIGPTLAIIVGVALGFGRPELLLLNLPLLALWFTSPLITWWLSRPLLRARPKLTVGQTRFLHKTARKTWGFFETFVTAEDNWLPPDNYQERPIEVIAHRTSPTNIGLALLANLTAYDFGYLSVSQLLERTANTLKTMLKLERYQGHFYNWYNTETLEPLSPRYISSVDSGNLAGHLLILRQGLLELLSAPLLPTQILKGLSDTLEVLVETIPEPSNPTLEQFRQLLGNIDFSFANWDQVLLRLEELCKTAEQIATIWSEPNENPMYEWSQKLLSQCRALYDEWLLFKTVAPKFATAANITLCDIAAEPFASTRINIIATLAAQAFDFAQINVSFLYDDVSNLMAIGYNVDNQRRDRSNYDLLASEVRLGNFVAIAQGQLPQESWFTLGRLLTLIDNDPILVSWGGSMFEYLMPLLVMPNYDETLLAETYGTTVRRQINYGKQRKVPWGISESGLNAVDENLNYQYRAFGVPGLGLKRGLSEDLVIAPYATVMALMIAPKAACCNMQRLVTEGAAGRFGFYEAIDYTPSRVPRGETSALVRSFMAHHQSMSFLALSYLLHHQPMQRRFLADPLLQTALLLLQERIPKPVVSYSQITPSFISPIARNQAETSIRVFDKPTTRHPEVQLLSNGRYQLMLTQAGGGYSRWKDIALTRWREDGTRDNWGLFGYLCDVNTGDFWSTSYQPTTGRVDNFKAVFTEGHAEFNLSKFEINAHTEVVVSPEDDLELRRLRIANHSRSHRTIEFTSYGEIVLAPQAADQDHPAFSNLFVATEILAQHQAILATRRPLNEQERPPWMYHLLIVHGDKFCPISFETDRANFIGRTKTPATPLAMKESGKLSNTAGAVLDPIAAIRCRIKLEPGESIALDLVTGITETREHSLALVEKYSDRRLTNRVFGLAWTHSQVLLRQLNITETDAQLFAKLAGAIIYVNPACRAEPNTIASNKRGQSGLWVYSISGDLPIVLLYIEDVDNIDLVRQLVRAHAYWRQKGLSVDLVILNKEGSNYRQTLQEQVTSLVAGITINVTDRAGGIFLRIAEQIPPEDHVLLQTVARVILSDKYGSLSEQLDRFSTRLSVPPRLRVSERPYKISYQPLTTPTRDLLFFNGLGGFSADGCEYVMKLGGRESKNKKTPAPWANILANPTFGSVLSESGQAYSWTENAHEFRLTPWDNDPLEDTAGEIFYLRDEETGRYWSPTLLPCPGRGEYETRHGFGYSVFEHIEDGIHSELWIYVALDAPVKFALLKVRNDTPRKRRLSATGYVEWVLGDSRTKNAMQVVTEIGENGALLARNHYNTDFGERTAFFNTGTSRLNPTLRTVTCDRLEFLGRNGSYKQPAALQRTKLSGRVGAGLDPCAAIQLTFDLAEGQIRQLVFTLGAGQNVAEAEALVQRFHGPFAAQDALTKIQQYWKRTLTTVQVKTPNPALNLLANGWLLYQVTSCRLWGRSGYYQSGGAFGFRDQLQDVMSLVHAEPQLFRAHLLLSAAHQFIEGDVQHWWHPPSNRGLRSRCSDDYLWLPFAMCRYVETTGDVSILDENVGFLQGRPLNADEESYYDLPTVNAEFASLYQHGVRAILHGLRFGEHGLPLMGSGDWNDGMNLVGIKGRGESIWLGFFLYTILTRFAVLAKNYGDNEFAERCNLESKSLQQHLEANGWDGSWYRRAYFDDGTPLGSSNNPECRIDAIAQSWSVLSGAAKPDRAKQAMSALNQYLVKSDAKLIQLLTPPFDQSTLNPGYIKGYVPGVRENGGQYTHAAIWTIMAFAELGETQLAWSLFDMINPINHGSTADEITTYKIEPYVIAADVYSVTPHIGRGGWSWYTGSASWTYRLITESLLGLHLQNKQLHLSPSLPTDWEGFNIAYRYGETVYQITISKTPDKAAITLDGVVLDSNSIPMVDDGQPHRVEVTIANE